jgi:hypothetical protein
VLFSILLLTMSQLAYSPKTQDLDRGVIYKEICDLFKVMTDKLDMMVEKELRGHQSRLKSSSTPRPMLMNQSMTATPSGAPSSAQPSNAYALSRNACLPYDNDKLCDHASHIFTTQLIHRCDNSILQSTPAALRRVHCIENEKGMELISSLNTVGYIVFDVLCNLNCLMKRMSQKSSLHCFT